MKSLLTKENSYSFLPIKYNGEEEREDSVITCIRTDYPILGAQTQEKAIIPLRIP